MQRPLFLKMLHGFLRDGRGVQMSPKERGLRMRRSPLSTYRERLQMEKASSVISNGVRSFALTASQRALTVVKISLAKKFADATLPL